MVSLFITVGDNTGDNVSTIDGDIYVDKYVYCTVY